MDKSPVEAWKAVTEFTKVIVSLATSVLTILVGYIALNSIELTFPNLLPPSFLVLAIVLSLYGFGRAIPAIKNGVHNRGSILFANLSVAALVLGILTIPLLSVKQEKSVDYVLKIVEQETQSLSYRLLPEKCRQVTFERDIYVLVYPLKEKTVTVKFSIKSNHIIFVGEEKTQVGKSSKS